MTVLDTSTGAALRAARINAGLTQAKLGEYAGLSQSYIQRLEAQRLIPVATQGQLREVLAVHMTGEHAPHLSELDLAYEAVQSALARYHEIALRIQAAAAGPADDSGLDVLLNRARAP